MKTVVLVWRKREGGSPEDMLNNWLYENKDKAIVRVTQSEGGTVTANYRITYTIFYEDKKE
jgi:hypothetical protein